MKDIKKPFLKSIISLALVVALVVGAVPLPKFTMEAEAAEEVTKTYSLDTATVGEDRLTMSATDPDDSVIKPIVLANGSGIQSSTQQCDVSSFSGNKILSNLTGFDGDGQDIEFTVFPNINGSVTKIEFTKARRGNVLSNDSFSMSIRGMKYNGTDDELNGVDAYNESKSIKFVSTNSSGVEGNLSLMLGPLSTLTLTSGCEMKITYIPSTAPVHEHIYSFNAIGNTLIATCVNDDGLDCSLADSNRKAIFTLTADGGYYGEHVFYGANHNCASFNAKTGLNATVDDIVYTNKSTGETSTSYVSAVGGYTATLVVHINGTDYTLTKDFNIRSDSQINNIYSQISISTADFSEINHAREDETVTLTFTSQYGEAIDSLSVKGETTNYSLGNGITKVDDTHYTFSMPGEEVTISATFDKYKITIDDSIQHGSVTATVGTTENATTAQVGDTVTIIAAPEEGYSLTALTYTPTGNDPVDILSTKSFTMPVNNVAVTATFELIPHTHNFTYSATDAVITATCANTDGNCPLADHKATLTIEAPLHTTYGDGKDTEAIITDVNSIKGEAKVQYQQKNETSYGTATESAPTDAGDYMASITLGTATASVEYTIAKAEFIVNPPTATATFGQTLDDVTLTNPEGNTAGTWAWVNDGTTSVGNVGNNTFEANFTPSDTNYSNKNNVDVVVTVSKAAAQTITDVTQNLLYTETSVSASVAGKMPENAGTLTYIAGAPNTTGNVTVSNFAVDTSGNVTATISGGVSGDTITLPVTISSTNYADSSVNVNITLIAKNTQTITASDVTATYGDTGKSISANVTEPATGGGTLSFVVKSGDAVTVDASSGALTIVKTGTAIITVTAAETATYAQATKDVTVTVDKADPVATAPTGLTAAYGQTLADVTLTNSESNTPGTWAWVNEGTTSVGNAGNNTFKVNFTPTDTENYNTVSNVEVTVNVGKADPTATAPSASATYGQTLDDVTLTNPTGNTAGTWEWVDSTTSVGTVGSHDFPANFIPNDTENYNSANNVNVTVTVGKADNPATVEDNATVVQGGNTVDLAGNVKKNGATGTVSYEISSEANGCTLNGSKLISGTNTGSVTVNVTVAADDNYNALAATPITVSITAKNTQTITASDVTATYGNTGKSISANVTEPSTGGGTLSYAVKSGSENYIGVDADGKLTIKAVPPTDGKAYVTVTAAETADYAAATKDVTVTIGKATLTVAAKNQNIYVGDTVPSLSEPVLNTHYTVTGLVGEDALTTAPTLEYKKEGSTVTPNNTTAGTYDIVPSGASAGDNYNVSYQNGSLTISEKDSATVTKVPKAKNLTYNGSAQELVTAGEADGGEMYYALGTEMEATETYSTSIPTGTEAKTYYVWYKAIGDGSHSDIEPKAIAVTISGEIIIKYDSNGGSGSMKDQKIEKGVETELKTNTFTRENYSFKEWNTKSDGSGDSYKDKAKVALNNGMTLYAQWTKVEVHNHTFEKVDAVEPGCETEGHKAYYRCTGCDKWFADAAGSVEITDKNSVIRKATGHRWDSGEVTKEATYTETGIRTYTCKNDGNHTKDEVIPVKQRDYSSDDRDSDSDDSDSGSSSSGVKRGIDVNGSSEATGNSSSGTDTSTNSGLSSGTTGMTAGSTGGPVTDTTNGTGTAGTNGNVGTVNGGLIGSTAAEGNGGLYDSGHQAVQVKEILSLSDMLTAVLSTDSSNSGNGLGSGYQVDALLIDDGMPLSDVGGTWSSGSEHWHYTKYDGTEAHNEWLNLNYNGVTCWYFFDEQGDMATGWVDYKGERYYLVPETDGWKGRMAEGWVRVDDKWYYFESTAGSTQGRLLRNGFTPDGHFVGDDGALVQ